MKARRNRPAHLLAMGPDPARRMVEILVAAGIPAFLDSEPLEVEGTELRLVGVPPGTYLRARSLLVEGASDLVVRAHLAEDPVFDLPGPADRADTAIFRELVPGGVTEEKVRGSLVEFYLRADPRGRRRALEAIELLGDERAEVVVEILEVVCRRDEDEERLWELARLAARAASSEEIGPLVALLRDPQPAVRTRAAMALGKIGDPVALPDLVRLYGDPSPRAQAEAADAVWRITGEDDGFDPDLPAEEKAAIQARWRARLGR